MNRWLRMLLAGIVAMLGSSLLVRAEVPETLCVDVCRVEYERQLGRCGTDANQQACVDSANSAYKTCLITCPGH